jgi:hypothetical protein
MVPQVLALASKYSGNRYSVSALLSDENSRLLAIRKEFRECVMPYIADLDCELKR